MFTIDLLKGEGLPVEDTARSMAVAAVASVVPAVVVIAMSGFFLLNKIHLSIQSGRVATFETKTEELSDAVARQTGLERDKAAYSACLAEAEAAIGRHTQWSPILVTIVGNLPESVVLTGLEVDRRAIRVKVPTKEDPQITKDVSITTPTLRMNVAATPKSDGYKDVRSFRDKLLASASLGPMLENITVSQKADVVNGLEVVSYEINCIFKPKL